MLRRTVHAPFEAWLRPGFELFRFDYNADRIDALAEERAAEWTRIGKADFLSVDEKREAVGYAPSAKRPAAAPETPTAPAQLERRYSPDQPRAPAGSPDGGRWTSAKEFDVTDIVNSILERGDLAHLALFLWACAATLQAHVAQRELGEATRRFDAFVRELARFNRRCGVDS